MTTAAKLKLCVITPTHWSHFMGGAQYQVKCILEHLVPTAKYDITYLANRIAPDFEPAGYQLEKLGDPKPRWGYLVHALPMYRKLKALKPDVIYQRVAGGHTGISAWYAHHSNARMIWHVAHDGDVSPGRLVSGNPVRRFMDRAAIRYGAHHADTIVTQTRYQADLLREHYGREATAVIGNFHPLPAQAPDKSGPLTVVWVANFKSWKQPAAFQRLAASLHALPDVRFVMVGAAATGDADADWSRRLLQQIETTPNLDYLGGQSQDAVNELLSRAHLFVNTSLHEGFANTFIQAWMREVPVVSLHVNPDGVFDDGSVGAYCGSEERLSQVVRELMEDHSRRSAMGACAYRYAVENHTVANVARLEALIAGDL
tara:strand:+ start:5611 stop:6726 length:1116 start_codon:yes stop_codon:yes gene_type:complete